MARRNEDDSYYANSAGILLASTGYSRDNDLKFDIAP